MLCREMKGLRCALLPFPPQHAKGHQELQEQRSPFGSSRGLSGPSGRIRRFESGTIPAEALIALLFLLPSLDICTMNSVDYSPRDLLGYGETTPDPQWPGGAKIAISLVVNYEEGSEVSFGLWVGESLHLRAYIQRSWHSIMETRRQRRAATRWAQDSSR